MSAMSAAEEALLHGEAAAAAAAATVATAPTVPRATFASDPDLFEWQYDATLSADDNFMILATVMSRKSGASVMHEQARLCFMHIHNIVKNRVELRFWCPIIRICQCLFCFSISLRVFESGSDSRRGHMGTVIVAADGATILMATTNAELYGKHAKREVCLGSCDKGSV